MSVSQALSMIASCASTAYAAARSGRAPHKSNASDSAHAFAQPALPAPLPIRTFYPIATHRLRLSFRLPGRRKGAEPRVLVFPSRSGGARVDEESVVVLLMTLAAW